MLMQAVQIALELKKYVVDHNLLEVSQVTIAYGWHPLTALGRFAPRVYTELSLISRPNLA